MLDGRRSKDIGGMDGDVWSGVCVIDNKLCMKEKKIPRDPVCDGKIVMFPKS